MSLLTLLAISLLSGSLVKLTDDIEDKNLPVNRLFALPFGISYGLLMGYLMLVDTDASLLFGGIVLGCLVTGKINSMGHYLGLSAILSVIFLYGIKLSPLVFLIAALAALDEMKNIFRLSSLNIVFDYRLILKLGILLLVIVNMLGLNALLILIAFDSAYLITGRINSRLS